MMLDDFLKRHRELARLIHLAGELATAAEAYGETEYSGEICAATGPLTREWMAGKEVADLAEVSRADAEAILLKTETADGAESSEVTTDDTGNDRVDWSAGKGKSSWTAEFPNSFQEEDVVR